MLRANSSRASSLGSILHQCQKTVNHMNKFSVRSGDEECGYQREMNHQDAAHCRSGAKDENEQTGKRCQTEHYQEHVVHAWRNRSCRDIVAFEFEPDQTERSYDLSPAPRRTE